MRSVNDYVAGLFADIPDSHEKEEMIQELVMNLEEKVADLVEQGKTEEDAVNKALVDLGDVSEIKNSLSSAGKRINKTVNYANRMWFSIWASALIIGLVLFINYYYTPKTIWFVYPTFAVLWWPLAMVFARLNHRK